MSNKEQPMKLVVDAFSDARDGCKFYTGIKDQVESRQCTKQHGSGTWCAMDVCPLLRDEARAASLGWD